VLITGVVLTVGGLRERSELEDGLLDRMAAHGYDDLVAALRRVLDGERDEDCLRTSLNYEHSAIVRAVLRGIADPALLEEIRPPDGLGFYRAAEDHSK